MEYMNRSYQLYRAILLLRGCDSHPARQDIYHRMSQRSILITALEKIYNRCQRNILGRGFLLLSFCKGLSTLSLKKGNNRRYIAITPFPNDKRSLIRYFQLKNEKGYDLAIIKSFDLLGFFKSPPLFFNMQRIHELRKIWSLTGLFLQRGNFFLNMRSFLGLGYFAKLHLLKVHEYEEAFFTSDLNPGPIMLAFYASSRGIKNSFICRAFPTDASPRLFCDKVILTSSMALSVYKAKGTFKGEVEYISLPGERGVVDGKRLLAENPIVGIFLPKEFNSDVLDRLISDLKNNIRSKEIHIRWHPNMSMKKPVFGDEAVFVHEPRGEVYELADRCDFVIGSVNSNIHLEILRFGVPTFGVSDINIFSGESIDLSGFVEKGIIPPPVTCISKDELMRVKDFYSSDWFTGFSDFLGCKEDS